LLFASSGAACLSVLLLGCLSCCCFRHQLSPGFFPFIVVELLSSCKKPPCLLAVGLRTVTFSAFGHLLDIIYSISNCVHHRGFFLMKLGHIVFVTSLSHFCCCVIRVVLGRLQCAVSAAAVPVQHLCLATYFQRLLDMVPKWSGSRQTLCRPDPMLMNTQERMEKHRCVRSLQPHRSSIYTFIRQLSTCLPS
jgi:hypothetical protein